MEVLDTKTYGYHFIPNEYLPAGKDEYWIRNLQATAVLGERSCRKLTLEEATALQRNGCRSGNWNHVLVTNPFDPALVRNTEFYGLVRLGRLEKKLLKYHDFSVPTGIRNATLVSCDIGDDVSIRDCTLISRYIIASRCILSRIDEMAATNHAKFGNGIIKEGEDESVRVWIDVMNEAGGRSILPFAGMIPADAYLWAAWRDDTELTEKLKVITQETQSYLFTEDTESVTKQVPSHCRGFYGTVGQEAVIKSCRIIKDTAIGPHAYIKGANKLKNISIFSSKEEISQVGEGVEMVNGIVGYGCHIFYGAKAVRFVLGNRSSVKYGARLIHSVLGDNSTVSCCEILNNLVFPVHEQHHNNSFLIAGLIEGMSNIAAGATLGSNHNSRANDGELRAGRGFWPGLSVTLKHSSRFASFCLLVKGDYPCELNIPLPFSLITNNVHMDKLEIMPAYFWMHNLYALERNSWKTTNRDKRFHKVQRIEADYLTPDTAEEIIKALELLEEWITNGDYHSDTENEAILVSGLERSSRGTLILKPGRAIIAYKEMLTFYCMKTIVDYLAKNGGAECTIGQAIALLSKTEQAEGRIKDWVNLGGQIVPAFRVDALRQKIREGAITSWGEIHAEYEAMAAAYDADRLGHAWAVWTTVLSESAMPESEAFKTALKKAIQISEWIKEHVKTSRTKDFEDPFRSITYRNKAEMDQVAGKIEDNPFIKIVEEKHLSFTKLAEAFLR
jgi:NDP-sugar pyrophosphorylase family protein